MIPLIITVSSIYFFILVFLLRPRRSGLQILSFVHSIYHPEDTEDVTKYGLENIVRKRACVLRTRVTQRVRKRWKLNNRLRVCIASWWPNKKRSVHFSRFFT